MSAEEQQEALIVLPPPGSVADLFAEVLPEVKLQATQGAQDVILTVDRGDVARVLRTARDDPRLDFKYLRCLSGVDHMEGGLEVVYHLYSYTHKHNVTIKTPLPQDDPRLASVTSIWRGADWHEREAAEMFGIVFQGHPDLRPLLLEEGLGYYPLLKSHPLAEIEEWQEELIKVETP